MVKYGKKKEHVETQAEIIARRKAKKAAETEVKEAAGEKDPLAFVKKLTPWGVDLDQQESGSEASEPERGNMFPGSLPKLVSISSDTTLRRWDIKTGIAEKVFVGHEGSVLAMDMNFDSWCCVTGSADNTLALWDVKNLCWLGGVAGHEGAISSVKMDWKKDRCITGSFDHTLRTWAGLLEGGDFGPPPFDDSRCTRILKDHTGPITCLDAQWHRNRAMSGSADNTAKMWDLETGQVITTLGEPGVGHTSPIWDVKAEFDRQQAYTVSMDRHLMHWDMRTATVTRATLRHESYVTALNVNWDMHEALTCSCDRTIAHWDLRQFEVMDRMTEHSGSVWCLEVDWPGKRMVTGAGPGDNAIRLWDLTDYFPEQILSGHDASVWCLAVDWELANRCKRELEDALVKDEDSDEREMRQGNEEARKIEMEAAALKMQALTRGVQARRRWKKLQLARDQFAKVVEDQKRAAAEDSDEGVEPDRPRFTD